MRRRKGHPVRARRSSRGQRDETCSRREQTRGDGWTELMSSSTASSRASPHAPHPAIARSALHGRAGHRDPGLSRYEKAERPADTAGPVTALMLICFTPLGPMSKAIRPGEGSDAAARPGQRLMTPLDDEAAPIACGSPAPAAPHQGICVLVVRKTCGQARGQHRGAQGEPSFDGRAASRSPVPADCASAAHRRRRR